MLSITFERGAIWEKSIRNSILFHLVILLTSEQMVTRAERAVSITILKEKGISGCGCAGDFPVEGNYYDIPELGENKKILELLFQKIETDLSDLLKELICSITFEKKDRKGCYVDYPLSKRQALSAQFAMQIQRTNLLRKQFEYIYDQLKAHVPCGSIPDYDKSDYKRLQNTQILSFDLAHFYANIFNDKK